MPTLVIIGPDGKALHHNVAEAIADHGIDAYPFTPEKFVELDEIAKAKEAIQTLESVLVSEDKDFVIKNDGAKVKLLIIEIYLIMLSSFFILMLF
jgi:nucleoredoxin